MSGMKNYLVKHGEKGFDKEVERERHKVGIRFTTSPTKKKLQLLNLQLKSTEFLNLDAILEGVLHCLVVSPLKSHLQNLFVKRYTKTGAIRLLTDNIHYASTRPISELAIKVRGTCTSKPDGKVILFQPKISLPNDTALQTISQCLSRLQEADSPLEKLEYLLAAIATIFNSVSEGGCSMWLSLWGKFCVNSF